MQNNYFGYVYGESIDEIINECNLAKNLEIIKDEGIENHNYGNRGINNPLSKQKQNILFCLRL